MRDISLFSFTGIWESWKAPAGESLETFAILTTGANSLMAAIHDRMPVILHPAEISLWLDPSVNDPQELQHLYQPYSPELMQSWQVSTLVNSPAHDAVECLQPVQPA